MKFSDNYIETKIIKHQKIINDEISYVEFEERKIIKDLIPNDSSIYYLWGNVGYAMLFNCRTSNLIKIKDLCFQIEKSIKRNDIDIVILEIKNVLLPLLDKLTNDEILLFKKTIRESAGPLYEYQPQLSTPQIFNDFIAFHKCPLQLSP